MKTVWKFNASAELRGFARLRQVKLLQSFCVFTTTVRTAIWPHCKVNQQMLFQGLSTDEPIDTLLKQ